ncbi:MAG TPA: N-acetyl-gamma-glutamyl-phosphate reductase [Hyphomonadaceae bacterium]|nr:N-acetyl-gamma-glutamyl-phosphate reductase [Hyphomonadaceae bacterium]
MGPKVFIDGEAGTTGLQIRQRLAGRKDLQVVSIDPEKRKDPAARADLLNASDAVILCLPDEPAKEAVGLVTSNSVKVIDASSAHRVAPGWTYGFPEMVDGQRAALARSTRISNPGCYPTGFIALMAPLVSGGLVPKSFPVTVNAVSGYTGGGKGLIEEFSNAPPESIHDAFRDYGLTLQHKHVPEMTKYVGLDHPPVFAPSVGRYAQGMIVEVPLQLWALPGSVTSKQLREALADFYQDEQFVSVASEEETAALQKKRAGAGGYVAELDPEALNNTNQLKLFVFANDTTQQVRLLALFDNLGKGASGAAVQNLNIALGLEESAGL